MALKKTTFSTLASKFLDDTFKDFRKSIVIKTITETADAQGGYTTAITTHATVNGFVFPMTGKEVITAGGLATDQMSKFMFKPVSGLTTKMKITFDSEDYQIRSIEDVAEANVWIKVIAQKGVAQ